MIRFQRWISSRKSGVKTTRQANDRRKLTPCLVGGQLWNRTLAQIQPPIHVLRPILQRRSGSRRGKRGR
jgi:hypothetical protein